MFSPLPKGVPVDIRAQAIARLTRLMKQDDGWLALFPPASGVAESYARFNRKVAQLSRRERRRARDGLLLELAGNFVDSAIENGLSYEAIIADITKTEEALNG